MACVALLMHARQLLSKLTTLVFEHASLKFSHSDVLFRLEQSMSDSSHLVLIAVARIRFPALNQMSEK
jgi:hypothetical protein